MKRFVSCIMFLALMMTIGQLAAMKIGVMWYTESVMAQQVYDSFHAHITKLAPDADIELVAGIPDLETVAKVFARFAKEKDAIVFLRSQGAEYLVTHPIDKPGFIGAANNPVDLGVLTSLNAPPQKSITGVSYFIDIHQKMKVFKSIFPEMKSVGLLLWEEHPATPIEWEGTEKACDQSGVQLHAKVCTTEEQIIDAAKELAEKVDVIIISSANKITDQTTAILEIAGKTPVVSYAENSVNAGALAGLVADDAKLGRHLAESVYKVLGEGAPVIDVPVRYDEHPTLLVNKKTMLETGVVIPKTVLEMARYVE